MDGRAGDHRRELMERIDARRAGIEVYLRRARPRGNRLITVAIVSSALAAVLTAGPALGGEPFSQGVARSLNLPSDSLVWRTLCFLALAVSLVAAISTNLAKSQDTERKIASAEAVNVELEGLRTMLEFGQIAVGDAAKLYQQGVAKIPWVDGQPTTGTAPPSAAPPLSPTPPPHAGPPWGPPPGAPPGWRPAAPGPDPRQGGRPS